MIFLLIGAFIAVIFFEVPSFIRQKQWRELAVFSFLLAIGFVMTALQTLGWELPNPFKMIDAVIHSFPFLSYD